jgi:chemosensory pili system protein ChpA (sensor histidine kinase/response regulator)
LPVDEAQRTHNLSDDIDEQLLPIFMEEVADLMPAIEKSIRNWQNAPDGEEQANMQRLLHTLKGSARMTGAMHLGELTHTLETDVIDAITHQKLTPETFTNFEAQIDQLNIAVDKLRNPVAAPVVSMESLNSTTLDIAQPVTAKPLTADSEIAGHTLRVRADIVDRLVNEAGEINIARSRMESSVAGIKTHITELNENVGRLRTQLRELEIQSESQMQSTLSHMQSEDSQFDPLEFDRFTRLQELTRMIAESVNDVSSVQQNLALALNETDSAITQQGRLAKDLQQALMHIRMVPLSSISDRLHRTVRLAAKDLGKKASLQLIGEHVEFDRSVLDKMVAPLEHLLRNSVAHGIELPQDRINADKSEYGEIVLYARQEGNEVVIALRDDGRGLDLPAIRAKAIENNLMQAEDDLPANELMQMIFSSGFSTAESVTTLAGRGVGMDVVKNEISQLGGRIDIASETGKGAQFTVYLPLTLAVSQAVLVHAGDRIFAISSSMVEQVQEYKTEQINELLEKGVISWQNHQYDFFYLSHLLGDTQAQPIQQQYSPVLLLKSGNQRAAVLVDKLIGNRELVIKNIGPQLARILGIAGATVLGNGQIVLILNPVQLAQRQGQIVRQQVKHTPIALINEGQSAAKTVMIVDDSLTVRKITSRILMREGYEVTTAKDGLDALQLLQTMKPDVMLLDIEMPRMDGFELTKVMRADSKMSQIPIIMITSRTADKHRDHAMSLGVNAYMGKPFQEDELLAKIAELANTSCPV